MANQGILQAQLKVKNSINLENGFVDNPLLKSVEGEINLIDENSFKGFVGNTAIEHLDTIKSSSQNAVDLTNSLNNLSNLKYAKLEGNFNSSTEGKFSGNTSMEKLDLSQDITIKPNDLAENESLRELPKLDFSNPDLTDIITNDTNLKPTTFDISNEPNTNKLGIHGDSTHQLGNLEFVKVNPEAPFDNQITPQIDTSYTSLDRNGLVNLFNTTPYNVGYTVVGSPTIEDGVVSGFNGTSNCITTSALSSQLFAADKFEVMLAIIDINSGNIGQDTNGRLFWYGGNNQGISITNNGLAMIWTYDNTNNAAYLWSAPPATGKCYVRFIKNGSTFTFGWSTDKTTWHDKTQEFETLPVGSSNPFYFLTGARFANVSKLDLNETYIKVNSQVSTGPVGYTVVGSPTIVDEVVSNFTMNNRIDIQTLLPSQINSFEGVFKFVCVPTWGGNTRVFTGSVGAPGYTWSPFLLMWAVSASNCWWRFKYQTQEEHQDKTYTVVGNSTTFSTVDYTYVKLEMEPIENNLFRYKMSYSTDGVTYTLAGYKDSAYQMSGDDIGTIRFAKDPNFVSTNVFLNKLDLNNTYIKVNGNLWFGHESKQVTWFNGKPSQIKVLDISVATGTSSLTNDDKAIVTNKGWKLVTNGSNSKNYTIEDGKLTWANSNIYLTGPVSYTTVGSPMIVDDVASGLSGSDYLKLPFFGQNLITDFEMNTECRLSSTTSGQQQQTLFGAYNSTYGVDEYRVIIYDNGGAAGTVTVRLVDYTDPDNIVLRYTTVLSGVTWGTYLKINLSCVNSQATVIVKDENDTVLANVAISHPVVLLPMSAGENPSIGAYRSSYAWKGSIDLKNTYIKLNGSLWFYGKNNSTSNIAMVPENLPVIVKGPVDYTVVGSPTIADGVASGFSGSDYLTTIFRPGANPWEMGIKFKTPSTFSWQALAAKQGDVRFSTQLSNMGYIQTVIVDSSAGAKIINGNVLQTNTDYWLKLVFDGSAYTRYISTDGINYSVDGTPQETTYAMNDSNDPLLFGVGRQLTNILQSSIDLNQTYIKVDGKLWFGQLSSTPSIGYVDMRTNVFNSAPQGTTYGWDLE